MKKILIISGRPFSKTINDGKTFESLFREWDKEKMAQLYFSSKDCPDFAFCKNYYNLTEMDVFRSVVSFNRVNSLKVNKSKQENRKDSKFMIFLKKNAKELMFIREFLWTFGAWQTEDLKNWIENLNPEVVFFHAGYFGNGFRVVKWIYKKYNIPYVIYFTDDYLLSFYNRNIIQILYQRKLCKFYKEAIDNASKHFAIGDLMAKDYSEKYGKVFRPLSNCIDFRQDNINKKREIDINRIVFSYIGDVSLNRWKSLSYIGEILLELESELSIKCRLNIYSIRRPDTKKMDVINTYPLRYIGPLDSKGVLDTISSSDFLIHVESIDAEYRAFTKYSLSTKIPEYLYSNRCVIAYGPHEIASIRIFTENKIGVVLHDLDSKFESKEKLKKVIVDNEFRDLLCINALQYVKEKFNGNKMRKFLYSEIFDISTV